MGFWDGVQNSLLLFPIEMRTQALCVQGENDTVYKSNQKYPLIDSDSGSCGKEGNTGIPEPLRWKQREVQALSLSLCVCVNVR